jgi:DMSO/TMAO reductase YedYZ heme-binding membrane subunit/uncharacterized protein with FMN-binding domain
MAVLMTLVLFILGVFFNKQIRKIFPIIFLVSLVTSSIAVITQDDLFSFINNGYLGLSFFIVVMYAGAFLKGSFLNKKLRSVRKEYSILGFITLVPHSIINALYYLNGTLKVEWIGITSFVIMLPLFVISFTYFKKKMNIKLWNKIQQFSYIAYAGIYIHLMIIGVESHKLPYTVIFIIYSALKLSSSIREKSVEKSLVSIIGVFTISIVLLFVSPIKLPTFSIPSLSEDEVVNITEEIDESVNYIDGIYDGYSTGFQNMNVYVQVTVENSVIISIEIIEYGASSPRQGMNFKEAANTLRDEIVDTQSTTVDAVSGATYTTTGLISAVKDALGIE